LPQSRLPDINHAFVAYRNKFNAAMDQRNWKTATGCLTTMNSLLPLEYRVRVSTEEYEKLSKTKKYKKCLRCNEESEDEITPVQKILTNSMSDFLLGTKSERLWNCPKCNEWNKISNTPRINQVLDSTMVFGVVTEPPVRDMGIVKIKPDPLVPEQIPSARRRFEIAIERWLWSFNREIEERVAQYRDDNWQKEQQMQEEIDTSMEK
tara:strand:- start:847 stop:1467 length:621 start_codon:yes stop_codon:yes gene_type:complete